MVIKELVMIRNLYGTFSVWHIQMRFTRKRSMGEIGHQHIQAPLAAAISSLAISLST